jgi:hypothetical protein
LDIRYSKILKKGSPKTLRNSSLVPRRDGAGRLA